MECWRYSVNLLPALEAYNNGKLLRRNSATFTSGYQEKEMRKIEPLSPAVAWQYYCGLLCLGDSSCSQRVQVPKTSTLGAYSPDLVSIDFYLLHVLRKLYKEDLFMLWRGLAGVQRKSVRTVKSGRRVKLKTFISENLITALKWIEYIDMSGDYIEK